ncbi:MAG: PKD domain-containing protein [Bacteroidetes bacterium]|nr:PKD domain-containing protein [Bacteroidota bacterium]
MKKQFLLFVFIMGALSGIFAQTVNVQLSGTVLRDSTNAPVPNHEVIIMADSSNSYGYTYYTTRFTNASGYYDCYIHNVPATGAAVIFIVKTKDCDSTYLVQDFPASATPVTVNFLLCNSNYTGCQAAFHSVVDSTNAYLVYFYDYSTSIHNIVSWHWEFGDGTSATISFPANPNVDHQYNAYGTYLVCLTIETADNCHSTVCHEVTVGQNTDCHALYHFQADSVNVTHVHFWDVSTPQNIIISRLWDFGDPASGVSNNATTGDPWHEFTAPGYYDVCLTIHTSLGCTSTKCDTITVGSGAANCENWITYTSSGLAFTFEGHTHSIYPTTYTWNFGDGSSSVTGQVVQHTYATSGSYTITLHTIDSTNCEWSRTQTIYAHSTCTLYGTAYLQQNSVPVDHGLAELIRVETGVMTIVDSVEFGDSAGMYWFNGVLPGHYYIRASLLPSSAYYGQYAPTYHFDAVNWSYATLIGLGQPSNPYNIHMHHINSYTSGNGNISGTITQNGKYNGNGTPAPDVEVLLLDASDQVLDFTMTNTGGEFSFASMAMGTYKIYPEIVGKTTTPSTVILDANHTSSTVEFAINGSNISGVHNETLPVDFAVSDIYPNPVTDFASLTVNTVHSSGITVGIFSITGQSVKEIPVTLHQGVNKLTIPVADLTKGLYYVKIGKPDGGVVVKKFVLNK